MKRGPSVAEAAQMSAEHALQATAAMQQQIAMMRNISASPAHYRTMILGDKKGLSRPQTFSGDEAQFRRWSDESESFFSGLLPDAD